MERKNNNNKGFNTFWEEKVIFLKCIFYYCLLWTTMEPHNNDQRNLLLLYKINTYIPSTMS